MNGFVKKQEEGDYMKYCFIINPRAGKGKFVDELEKSINDTCSEAKVEFEIFKTYTLEDGREYINKTVKEYDGRLVFFACGGDGTLCGTIISVMGLDEETKKRVSVGIVPKGTGNDFVSNFTNKELFCDIKAQIDGSDYDIDLLKCNDLYSVNMINIGFDCHVVCKKEEIGKKKIVPRKLAYIVSLLATLIKKPTVSFESSLDGGERQKKDLLLTTIANGGFCGGGFHSNPIASLTDGNLDCIEAQNMSRTRFLALVGDYKNGKHLEEKFDGIIDNFKCKTADIYFDEITPVSVDGEIIREREIHISVISKALTIILPNGVKPLILGGAVNDVSYSV
jgi:YegS/Rv2252/BmrU family lipid kinase